MAKVSKTQEAINIIKSDLEGRVELPLDLNKIAGEFISRNLDIMGDKIGYVEVGVLLKAALTEMGYFKPLKQRKEEFCNWITENISHFDHEKIDYNAMTHKIAYISRERELSENFVTEEIKKAADLRDDVFLPIADHLKDWQRRSFDLFQENPDMSENEYVARMNDLVKHPNQYYRNHWPIMRELAGYGPMKG